VERRKARARVYSHHALKRDEAKMQSLAEDVDMMQVFRRIVEDAPDMMAVVSPDLDCSFLYANKDFEAYSKLGGHFSSLKCLLACNILTASITP